MRTNLHFVPTLPFNNIVSTFQLFVLNTSCKHLCCETSIVAWFTWIRELSCLETIWWKLPQEKLLNSSSLLRTSRIHFGRIPLQKIPKCVLNKISENAVLSNRPNWNHFTPVVYPQRNKNKEFVDLYFTIPFLFNGILCPV